MSRFCVVSRNLLMRIGMKDSKSAPMPLSSADKHLIVDGESSGPKDDIKYTSIVGVL
jgi:hypothetical protein